MKKMNFKIDQERFYMVGKYIFFLTGTLGIVRILDLWTQLKAYDVVSSIASAIFQFLLSALFAYLHSKEFVKEVPDKDVEAMNKALDNLKL